MISARGISASLAVHAVFAGWIVNAAPLPSDIVEDAEAAPAIEVLLEIEPEPVAEPAQASPQQQAMVMERAPAEPVVEVTEAIDLPEPEPEFAPIEPLPQLPQVEVEAAKKMPVPEIELPPLPELPPLDLSDLEKPFEKMAEVPVVPVPEKVAEPQKPAPRIVEELKPRKADVVKPKEQKPQKKVAKTAKPPKAVKPAAEKTVAALKNSASSKKAFAATAGSKALASGGKAIDPGYKSRILSKLRAAKRAPKASVSGRVILNFTVSRSGSLLSARIAKSGGPALDQATIAMARAAAPFPPMPAGMNGASMSFTVPVQYN
jgi:periplasmic protein TonB